MAVYIAKSFPAGAEKRDANEQEQQKMTNSNTPANDSDTSSVFGSPPEPIFSDSKHSLSTEMLQVSLSFLASQNEAAMTGTQRDDTRGAFKSGNPIIFLFELCKRFDLSSEVQYRAAELFQRFMHRHIVELRDHVRSTQATGSPISWSEVETRLKHQVPLRAVSCVQLASKLSSHYSIVSIGKAKRFLTASGYRYATSSIVQSEVRVLKTLCFQVHLPTPVEYLEGLLGALSHNNKTLPVKQLHGIALKVLDVSYICRNDIVGRRLEKMFSDEDKVSMIESNLMLLASAILATASYILDQSNFAVVVLELSHVTCLQSQDIVSYASILLDEITSDPQRSGN